MNDVRYSEFLFLQRIATGDIQWINRSAIKPESLAPLLTGCRGLYEQMAVAALENLHIQLDDENLTNLVFRLRGEIPERCSYAAVFKDWEWNNPRKTLERALQTQNCHRVLITYRGLQRIETLREQLQQDRILEPFKILLDLRYFRQDLEDAIKRSTDTAVSVLYGDMDHFKRINDGFGHEAGDVVMKAYLECVRDGLGQFGTGYRGRGDETVGLIIGQDAARSGQIAEDIRKRVEALQCEHKGVKLPKVSASIGLATTPPAERSMELESLADQRQAKAKERGKNKVIFS